MQKISNKILVIFSFCLFNICIFSEQISILNYKQDNDKVKIYEKLECSFELSEQFSNPFDSEKADIIAKFHSPNGNFIQIPAFYYQEFKRTLNNNVAEKTEKIGHPLWKVRFTPTSIGNYQFDIIVNGEKTNKTPYQFECIKGSEKGFIRISKKHPEFFCFDNFDSYYPIGHNIRFPAAKQFKEGINFKKGSFLYEEIMHKMSLHGENFIVIGMEPWWLGLEWSSKLDANYQGIGKYNLRNAYLLDKIIEKAYARDMKIALFLTSHGQYAIKSKKWPDGHWKNNPYNTKNGGSLLRPNDFFRSNSAKKSFKKMLRYIVARWGYSPNIFSWLLLSEADLTQSYLDRLFTSSKWDDPLTNLGELTTWHKEMGHYLKTIDPWKHLVSSSFAFISHGPEIWKLPEMDFVFNTAFISSFGDTAPDIIKSYDKLCKPYKKPYLLAEYGGHARWNEEVELMAQFHTGIWSQYMNAKCPGSVGFWWWSFIESKDLYSHYKALADFNLGENRSRSNFIAIDDITTSNKKFDAMGVMNNNKHYLWVYEKKCCI